MQPATVWRYSLSSRPGLQRVQMPKGARILAAANQAGGLSVWAIVDPGEPEEWRSLLVLTTGAPMPLDEPAPRHIGTAVFSGGGYVVHVFELGGPEL